MHVFAIYPPSQIIMSIIIVMIVNFSSFTATAKSCGIIGHFCKTFHLFIPQLG